MKYQTQLRFEKMFHINNLKKDHDNAGEFNRDNGNILFITAANGDAGQKI
jgi:hypothetical protein